MRALDVVVDEVRVEGLVAGSRRMRERHLDLRVAHALQDLLLRLRAAAPEARLEHLHRRRLDPEVLGVEAAALDVPDALDVNVQNADLPDLLDVLDGGLARAVVVPVDVGALDEEARVDVALHAVDVAEVVVDPVLLAGPRRPRRVRHAKPEGLLVVVHQLADQRPLARPRASGDHERWKE